MRLAIAAAMSCVLAAQVKKVDRPPVPTQQQLDEFNATVLRLVPLSDTAKKAVQISSDWVGATNIPDAGADGRVMYTFGAGLPTIVCAPLRVCVIELQAGEHVTGEPALGDTVRWELTPRTVGEGRASITLVVVKPKQAGLKTNLLLTTDRRAYYLELQSKQEEYTARVAFSYPDERSDAWKAEVARQQAERAQAETKVVVRTEEPLVPSVLDLSYESKFTKGHDASLRPTRVGDDGTRVYITMPPSTAKRSLPVLMVVPAKGDAEMVNYRVVQGDTFVVDRLFEHAKLVSGTGKAELRVDIYKKVKHL